MKRRFAIINFGLMLTVLFSILFQSVHSYEHFEEELSARKCQHHYGDSKTEITHQHHIAEHCFECNFSFSHFVSPDVFSFSKKSIVFHNGYSYFKSGEITRFFRGSLFSHRGPPTFIV